MLGKKKYHSSRSRWIWWRTMERMARVGKELSARSWAQRDLYNDRRVITVVETNWRLINARLPLTIVSRARQGARRMQFIHVSNFDTSRQGVESTKKERLSLRLRFSPITFTRSFISLPIWEYRNVPVSGIGRKYFPWSSSHRLRCKI